MSNIHAGSGSETISLVETTLKDLVAPLSDALIGRTSAVLVKKAMTTTQCSRVRNNFDTSAGMYRREDGVTARMVGTNSYLKNAATIVQEYDRNHRFAELLFSGVPNVYRELYDRIEEAGYRFRPAYIDGVPAPTHRASIWDDRTDSSVLLKAHTDWPQVRNSGLEFSTVENPIAVNFYASHPARGSSWVRIYDFVPSEEWLEARGIAAGGHPIELDDLKGVRYLDVKPEEGDLLLFASNKVHAVFSAPGVDPSLRLNINGFIGFSPCVERVLAWA